MDKQRQLEIALKVLEWRYRQLGTEQFMGELKAVSADTGIPDEEMFEFYKALAAEMK